LATGGSSCPRRQKNGEPRHCPDWRGPSFTQAVAIAREQRAKFFELCAAADLARLWRDQGKRIEARELLAPISSWFTEGFDAVDLKEAKTLLDELT
jgi:predicted ATPase